MDEEREKQRLSDKTVRVINSLIDRFLRDEDEDESKGVIADFFEDIKERIKQKLPKSKKSLAKGSNKAALPEGGDKSEASGAADVAQASEKDKK